MRHADYVRQIARPNDAAQVQHLILLVAVTAQPTRSRLSSRPLAPAADLDAAATVLRQQALLRNPGTGRPMEVLPLPMSLSSLLWVMVVILLAATGLTLLR